MQKVKKENEDIEQNDVCESIKMFSEMISPVLLPMIDVMGVFGKIGMQEKVSKSA